jgi:hypothetical protein
MKAELIREMPAACAALTAPSKSSKEPGKKVPQKT